MAVQFSQNSYYVSQFTFTPGQKGDLLAAVTPQEVYNKVDHERPWSSTSSTTTGTTDSYTSRVSRDTAATEASKKIVYEIDGKEFNPVDFLFENKSEKPKNESWKSYFKAQFGKFKQTNEKLLEEKNKNKMERKQRKQRKQKKESKENKENQEGEENQERVRSSGKLEKLENSEKQKQKSHAVSVKSSQVGSPNMQSNLKRQKRVSKNLSDKPSLSNAPAPPVHKTSTRLQQPVYGHQQSASLSDTIWNYFSYYWAPESPEDEPEIAHVSVIKKKYAVDKKGALKFVGTENGTRVVSTTRVTSGAVSQYAKKSMWSFLSGWKLGF